MNMTSNITVVIKRDQNGEYRVPDVEHNSESCAYYTDDCDDAVDTCYAMNGHDVKIVVRSVRCH